MLHARADTLWHHNERWKLDGQHSAVQSAAERKTKVSAVQLGGTCLAWLRGQCLHALALSFSFCVSV